MSVRRVSPGLEQQLLRTAIVETALAMNAHGINRGKSGNVSARCRSDGFDGFVVTPTGLPYDETGPEDGHPIRAAAGGVVRRPQPLGSKRRFHSCEPRVAESPGLRL